MKNLPPRLQLLNYYKQAIHAVNPRDCVRQHLQQHPTHPSTALIALGKAAFGMTLGAFDALGTRISRALIITKQGTNSQFSPHDPITYLEASHPLPDESSLRAGQVLLDYIQQLPPQQPVLCLLSGGASALVEVLPSFLTLSEWKRINHWLLGSGLDIHAINQVRKSLSLIKAGRLIHYLQNRPLTNLLISDVPGNDLCAIGSGPLVYHAQLNPPSQLPSWLQNFIRKSPPLPPQSHFEHIQHHLVAYPELATQAIAKTAQQQSWTIHLEKSPLVGEALITGHTLAQQLYQRPPGLLFIGSSETTVSLPPQPGQGGRCQTLALAAALQFAQYPQHEYYLLAAGTDGQDGPGTAAGALVDKGTIARGQTKGLDPHQHLRQANAGYFLAASGDLINTGLTGTNVMDILIALKTESSA